MNSTHAADSRGDIRQILFATMHTRIKTPAQAEDAVRNSMFELGLPLVAVHVEFLPDKERWAEAAALVDGESLCVELLTRIR